MNDAGSNLYIRLIVFFYCIDVKENRLTAGKPAYENNFKETKKKSVRAITFSRICVLCNSSRTVRLHIFQYEKPTKGKMKENNLLEKTKNYLRRITIPNNHLIKKINFLFFCFAFKPA